MEAQLQTMNPFLQSKGHPDTSPSAAAPTPSGSSNLDTSSTLMGRVIARESELDGQENQGSEFFGSTSIYHLSSASQTSCISGGLPLAVGEEKRSWAFEDEPELDPSNEPELIVSHLLDLFWNWQAIHLQVFHRELFLAEKKLFDTERPRRRYVFFSPSLLYAIMALGAMMSPDRGVKYQSTKVGGVAGDIYFEKARKLFDQEMAEPTITTVQTALALGSRYGSKGHSALGWIYSGIAIRMAIQIGLHIDCQKNVACKQMSPEIAEVRKLVFWGCYIQDKLWSAYTGRPSFIMDWNITVALPEEDSRLRGAGPHSQDVQEAVHRQILLLTRKCSAILTELYSRKNECDPENLRKAASEIHLDLLTWHKDLPETLKWPNDDGTPTSPHVLVMYMQFYFTMLLLHRPFIDLDEVVATIPHLSEGQPSATTICTLAATNIAKLARDYSLFYSLSQIASPAIHFIFIAATIHMINHKISPGNNHDYLFQGCLASLLEIGSAYPMSHKAAAVLQELAGRLQPHGPVAEGLDRSTNNDTSSEPPVQGSGKGITRPLDPTTAPAGRTTDSGLYDTSPPLINPSSSGLDMSFATAGEPRNFDWSTYNSPITLPTNLSIFDVEAFDYSGGATTTFPSQFGYASDPTNIMGGNGASITRPPFTTVFPATNNHDTLPSATFFDNFYGTSFGLNY
ncbi:Fungal specific transcription factor domain-containing protein [Cladophialophora immunda]|nr:Fungal specific transcription factor domain-containing protein [Cladophialophora immunda]